MKVGWYVHHSGSGHAQRACTVAPHIRGNVTVLSSAPQPDRWTGEWLSLPLDTGHPSADPTARGALHWAPVDIAGYRDRMQLIARWIAAERPDVMVVDVSVEVCALTRLVGIPTVTVVMPGDRTDRPHRLGYALCDGLIALWPQGAHPVAVDLEDRLTYVRGVSRFDELPEPADVPSEGVLVVCGGGDVSIDERDIEDARRASGLQWRACGGRWPKSTDLWRDMAAAGVVVTFAGQNSIAEVSAARRPAIVIAAERPHGEHLATVRALRSLDVAVALDAWPRADEWPRLIAEAREKGGDRWATWSDGRGAIRMAAAIEKCAAAG